MTSHIPIVIVLIDNKITYFQYIITPKGIAEKTRLTLNFMKKKMDEYNELKDEIE